MMAQEKTDYRNCYVEILTCSLMGIVQSYFSHSLVKETSYENLKTAPSSRIKSLLKKSSSNAKHFAITSTFIFRRPKEVSFIISHIINVYTIF